MKITLSLAAAMLWLFATAGAQAQNQTMDIKVLTLEGARTVIAGAFEEARRGAGDGRYQGPARTGRSGKMNPAPRLVAAALLGLAVWVSAAPAGEDVFPGKPEAVVDLATREGVALLKGEWRYSDTRLVQIAFHDPGADNQPTGPDTRTWDYLPKAGARDFDDGSWARIDPV